MKKQFGLIISGLIIILFFGGFLRYQIKKNFDVLAQDIVSNQEILIPTVVSANNINQSSAQKRIPISLKTNLNKVYATKEKINVELFNQDGNSLTVELKNNQGQILKPEVVQNDNLETTTLVITPPPQFRPGKYTMMITDQTGQIIEQDFLWGVLAINPNKSIYHSGEVANLAMAVLDDLGKMVCNSILILKITDKTGKVEELSTDNGKIKVNSQCVSKSVSLIPDYEASYKLDGEGKYNLELTAQTANGNYTINDQIEVSNSNDFDVERISATRIYPGNEYPMTINVTADRDFSGNFFDEVPSSFEISELVGVKKYVQVSDNGINKKINWEIDIKKGEKITLGYKYKAPFISPQFYLTGPLTMTTLTDLVYTEGRQWQIASDDTGQVQIRQEINIINGSIGVTGTDAAIVNVDTSKYSGTVNYYFEVIANKGAGNTLTINLSTGNTNTVGIGISNTSDVRVRKQFTPESGSFDYRLNLTTGTTVNVKAARIIILQSSATEITATETQIEIGNLEIGLSNATTAPLTSPKYWTYTANAWDVGTTFYAEISYKKSTNLSAGSTFFASAGTFNFVSASFPRVLTINAWGAGGGGGNRTASGTAGGGGGGAVAIKNNYSLSAGVGLTVTVGIGRSMSNGGNSFVVPAGIATTIVKAEGGIGVTTVNIAIGGRGGLVTNSIGDTKYDGGIGATGATDGGGGGGGAGDAGNGGNANNAIGGTGGAGIGTSGGTGGGGATKAGSGTAGSSPGGGGGGARRLNSGTYYGGTGANGRVEIAWPGVNFDSTFYLQEDNGSFTGWTNVATIVSAGTATTPTRIRSSNFTPTDGRHYRIVGNINNSLGTYDIYNAKIVADQTSATAIRKFEGQYLLLNTKSTSIGATLGYQQLWDSSEWVRTTNVYKHAVDSIGVGTSAQLVDIDNSNTLVTGSKINGVGQTIGGNLTMPTTGHRIDTWLLGSGEVDASRILVQTSIIVFTPATSYTQASFRWSDDSEGEIHSTSWLASENVGVTGVFKNTNIRVRFSVYNTGDTGTVNYRLQIAPLGAAVGCTNVASGNFKDVPTTFGVGTSLGLMTTSPNIADQTTTTRQLTISGTTFVSGKTVTYSSNQSNPITLMQDGYTELEYVFQFTNSTSKGAAYCLRVSDAGTAISNYSQVAKATMISENSPSVILDSPSNGESFGAVPNLTFTGTDLNDDTIEFNLQIDTVNTFDSSGVSVDTYYFNDPAPTDPQSAWTGDASAFDGSTSTYATTSTNGSVSSNYLYGIGTTAPSSGNAITQVRARIYSGGYNDINLSYPRATIYTSSLTENLGSVSGQLVSTAAPEWSNYITLSTPSGGWTWAKLQQLEVKIYLTGSASTTIRVFRVEIEVTSGGPMVNVFSLSDPGFTTGHPFTSNQSVTYTVQTGLPANTYYWRVAGIDLLGSNTYGNWSNTNSFSITSSGGPALNQLMRHGMWFNSSGTRQPFAF